MWGVQSAFGVGELSNVIFAPAAAETPVAEARVATKPAAARRLVIERHVEHEARGLLNAIGLLDRCLATVVATESERLGWSRELRESQQRLEQLYAEGLDRNFHVKQ